MKYVVKTPVLHGGKTHKAGAEIELSEAAAADLLACRAIAVPTAEEKPQPKGKQPHKQPHKQPAA
jgi:hypothetical protein